MFISGSCTRNSWNEFYFSWKTLFIRISMVLRSSRYEYRLGEVSTSELWIALVHYIWIDTPLIMHYKSNTTKTNKKANPPDTIGLHRSKAGKTVNVSAPREIEQESAMFDKKQHLSRAAVLHARYNALTFCLSMATFTFGVLLSIFSRETFPIN